MKPGKEQGLLSDIQILERVVAEDQFCIFVSPLINPAVQLGPASLDLHLGGELLTTKITSTTHIDLTQHKEVVGRQTSRYLERESVEPHEALVLHPNEFALGGTVEFLRLPADIAGRLEGRSSLGRIGLQIHATAGFVDPGFEGTLTFELINAGKVPIKLRPGLRIGQICFFHTRDVQVGYMDKSVSKYGGKFSVEGSNIHDDPEILASED